MCLGFHPGQLRPEAFPLLKPEKKFTMCPLAEILPEIQESSLWLETLPSRRHEHGPLGDWRCFALKTLFESFLAQFDPPVPAFPGATSCSNNTAELTGFAEANRWAHFFMPRGERVRTLFDFKHVAHVTLGVAHAKKCVGPRM